MRIHLQLHDQQFGVQEIGVDGLQWQGGERKCTLVTVAGSWYPQKCSGCNKSHGIRKKYETGRSPLRLFAAVAHNSGRLWSEVDRCLSPQLGDTHNIAGLCQTLSKTTSLNDVFEQDPFAHMSQQGSPVFSLAFCLSHPPPRQTSSSLESWHCLSMACNPRI